MEEKEFSEEIKEQALKRANYRCERCWSRENLRLRAIDENSEYTLDNCVVLCESCYEKAPQDPFLFKNLFLRFASPKEMISFYNAENEEEALRLFCEENGIEYERLEISREKLSRSFAIKQGMKKSVEKRGHAGFNIPYGYDYKDGELKINDDEAKTVKNIYSWYISGKGLGEIAKMLNSAKVPTKRGGFWAKKTISSILKNPVYCGYFRWENKITKSRHQRIIDEETFKKVQKIIEQRGGKSSTFDF